MPETSDLLLTDQEVQAVTNEPLSAAQAAAVAVQATEAVRDRCGWRVAKPADETFTLSSRGGRLLFLPSLHVNSVATLTENGEPLTAGTDFDWDENGVIERIGRRWPRGRRLIVATINHGYDTCPGGIAQAIAAAVARGVLAPAGGIASETAIGQSIVYSRMSAGGLAAGAMFVDDEFTRIDEHRLRASR
ncbi:hypothetical protein [Microbacterium aurantiacum]|uniref:hypothetical protein n=1 Tax=Microbacterium aurantiacum TaxID=162393 RepID=UPI000C80BD67|nr:hypothetical protein [Microbacterium aurantiacum]